MSIIDRIIIFFTCDFVGQDQYGHDYYIKHNIDSTGRKRRYVMYNGTPEPSKIPPMWHAWLHYLSNEVPLQGKSTEHIWQKEYQPNLTGTKKSYYPSKTRKDDFYTPWKP